MGSFHVCYCFDSCVHPVFLKVLQLPSILELNGIPGGTSGSSFVQNPSVVLEIRFRPMHTIPQNTKSQMLSESHEYTCKNINFLD